MNRLLFLRIGFFGIMAMEAISHALSVYALPFYESPYFTYPVLESLALPVPILWIMLGRFVFSYMTAIGYYPNFFKFFAFLFTFLEYNQNFYIFYNNHYYLEFILSFFLCFAFLPQKHYKLRNAQEHQKCDRLVILSFYIMLMIVYFYAAVVKFEIHSRPPMQSIGILIDLILSVGIGAFLFWPKARFIVLFVGIIFHVSTIFFFDIGMFPFLMIILIFTLFLSNRELLMAKRAWKALVYRKTLP